MNYSTGQGDRMQLQKIAGLWGMAARSGKVAAGDMACENAIREGQAKWLVVCGVSGNTKKKFTNLCKHFDIPLCEVEEGLDISGWTGKRSRKVFAILDSNLANALEKAMTNIIQGNTENLGV